MPDELLANNGPNSEEVVLRNRGRISKERRAAQTPFQKQLDSWTSGRNDVLNVKGERIRPLPYSECQAIWNLIEKECGKKVDLKEVNIYWARFSIEYISSVLNREFTLDIEDYLKRCKSFMAEYLTWKESALYANVKVYGERLVDEWALSKYALTVKMLVDKIENDGSMKASEILLKSVGKGEGNKATSSLPKVEWVKNYKIEPGKSPVALAVQVPVSGESTTPKFDAIEIKDTIVEEMAKSAFLSEIRTGKRNKKIKSQKINQVVEDLKNEQA